MIHPIITKGFYGCLLVCKIISILALFDQNECYIVFIFPKRNYKLEMKYLRGKNKSPCMETFKFHIHRTLFHVQTVFTKYNDFFFAASSVCQSPVISSSIKLSKALPFYAVGSEINYQCSKPGYEISGIFNLWKYLYTLF